MSTPASPSRPVLIMSAVLAGASAFVSGAAFFEAVPRWIAGLAALIVSATTIGWGVYTQGQVRPEMDVAAYRDAEGQIRSGPAATVKDHQLVDVTEAGQTKWT